MTLSSASETLPAVATMDRRPAPRAPHVEFLGLRFCLLTQAQVVAAIVAQGGAPYRYVVTPNSYHVVSAHEEPARILPIYRSAWLSLCDSRILKALARLDRRALPLVTGSDLVAALLGALNGAGASESDRRRAPKRILVVGPQLDAEAVLCAAFPALEFVMLPAPPGLAQSAARRSEVARSCLDRQWDIALLCVGCPAQELIARELAELGCRSGVALCVGASIDFLTGARVRAPLWLQKLGLEWGYRLAQEPVRLWRRYLIESPKIVKIFMTTRRARQR